MSSASQDVPLHIQVLASSNVLIPEVQRLERMMDSLGFDTPNVQCDVKPIKLEIAVSAAGGSNPLSYQDHKGFSSEFGKEMEIVAKIDVLVAQGNEFVSSLYTYRPISRALPLLTSMEITDDMTEEDKLDATAKRVELTKKISEILRPGILKIKEVMIYITEATTTFHNVILHLVDLDAKRLPVPEGLYSTLIRLIDILVKLDNLKDMKFCLQNDFSRYKRSVGSQLSTDVLSELTQIQSFLAGQDPRLATGKNHVFLKLRDEVKRIRGHEEILSHILYQAADYLESGLYVTPDEKFQTLRVLPHLLLMIDGDLSDPGSFNVFKAYKSKLQPIQKLFRRYPVVPLYGDMTIQMQYILMRAGHFDAASMTVLWTPAPDSNQHQQQQQDQLSVYDLNKNWPFIRKEYDRYATQLTSLVNNLRANPFRKHAENNDMAAANHVLAEEVAKIVYEGFAKLSEWNSLVQLFFSWKYTHPCSTERLDALGVSKEAADSPDMQYARAVRYNLSAAEINTAVDVISLIKSLSALMMRAEDVLAPIVRFYVHHTVQQLVQGDMLPLLHRCDKRGKKPVLSELLAIRHLAADWFLGVEPKEDYKNYHRRFGQVHARHPSRVVGTSPTQLLIVRSQVRAFYDNRSSVNQKSDSGLLALFGLGRRELEAVDVQLFQKFYTDSFYFPYLLDFSSTLDACCDIGALWYREFYLELTKCIQFPIEMSIPWILTEQIIANQSNDDSPMIENILFCLDIYNDAAHRALFVLRQQHLYDEIEAEANLVFDQLIFLLADEIYNYYKTTAAASLLERSYKAKLEELKGTSYLTVKKRRYEIPMAQRQVQLLGRSINLTFLIGQHINSKLFHDIDIAIKVFESSDLSGVIELNSMLEIFRETHCQLTADYSSNNSGSNSSALQIDDFQSILNEVNESFSPTSFKGRISFHVLKTLVMDVFPNFSYNFYTHRFVRSPVILRPVDYAKSPKQATISHTYGTQHVYRAYEHWHKLSRGYIGVIHWQTLSTCMSHLSQQADLFMVIEECLKNLREKLEEVHEYVGALQGGIPPLKFPKYVFQTVGSFGYFEGKLRPILEYDDLKPEVFQNIREIGNTVAVLRDLSDVLDVNKAFAFVALAPLVGVAPDTTAISAPTAQQTPLAGTLLRFFSALPSAPTAPEVLLSQASAAQSSLAAHKLVASLSQPLVERKSLFRGALRRIQEELFQLDLYTQWSADPAHTGSGNSTVALDIDKTKAFHKLWSALTFLFCLPLKSNANNHINSNNNAADGNGSQSGATDVTGGSNDGDDDITVTDEDEFGHGFTIGGCVVVHMLGQRTTFELLDFSAHVLRVYEHSLNSVSHNGASTGVSSLGVDQKLVDESNAFIEAYIVQRKLQDEIFALLQAQHPVVDGNPTAEIPPTEQSQGQVAAAVVKLKKKVALTFHPSEAEAV